jgi:hypothetical protein
MGVRYFLGARGRSVLHEPLDNPALEAGLVHLSRGQRALFNVLWRARQVRGSGWISQTEIRRLMWGDEAFHYTPSYLRVLILRLRRSLAGTGWAIEADSTAYRLVFPEETDA